MDFLDLDALVQTPVRRESFEFLLLDGFVKPQTSAAVAAAYPVIDKPGSFTLDDLEVSGAVADLIEALKSDAFREVIEDKFDVDLKDKPTTFTLRGVCGERDGGIHTDSKTKIITILIYLNEDWAPDGGRLRLLRNGQDLDDYIAEVSPTYGSLIAFRRSESSWHGHKQFVGPRRVLQMNWVVSDRTAKWQMIRHRVSAAVKRLASPAA